MDHRVGLELIPKSANFPTISYMFRSVSKPTSQLLTDTLKVNITGFIIIELVPVCTACEHCLLIPPIFLYYSLIYKILSVNLCRCVCHGGCQSLVESSFLLAKPRLDCPMIQ